MSSPSSS